MWSRLSDADNKESDAPPSVASISSVGGDDLELQPLSSSPHIGDQVNIGVSGSSEQHSSGSGSGVGHDGNPQSDDSVQLLPSSEAQSGIVNLRSATSRGMTPKRYWFTIAVLALMCIVALIIATRDTRDLVFVLPPRNSTATRPFQEPSTPKAAVDILIPHILFDQSSNCSTNCSLLHGRCENATCICIDDHWSGPECNQEVDGRSPSWIAFYIVAIIAAAVFVIAMVWWSYRRRRCCFSRCGNNSSYESDFVSLDKVRATSTSTSGTDARRTSGRHTRNRSDDMMSSSRQQRSRSGSGATAAAPAGRRGSGAGTTIATSSSSSPRSIFTRSSSRSTANTSPKPTNRKSAVDGSTGSSSSSGSSKNHDNNDPSTHPLNHQNHRYRSTDDDEDQETFVYLTPPQPSYLSTAPATTTSYQSSTR